MCSDTWPNKNAFWRLLFPGILGCLGLFHCKQRIIGTLRKKHVDCCDAVTNLLAALYTCHTQDYEKLLAALKEGKLSSKDHKYTSDEIADMKASKFFWD